MLPWQNSARANRFASITQVHQTYPVEQRHNMQPIYQMLQNQNRNIAHLNREISYLEDKLKDLRKNSRNYQRETDKILLNQSDHIASVNTNISNLETNIQEVQTATQTNSASYDNLTEHIAVGDNNFSIDNVNTISKEYINCVNKLNFTINLINEKKGDIQGAGDYAYVLRPIFEKKYTDNAVSINGYIVVASAEPVKMIHFFEPDSNWDNKQNNIWNAYREKCETDGYNRFNELRGKSPKKTQFYVLIPYDWETGVKIAFYLYIPDILGKTCEEWIKIVSGFNLTPSITKYTKISDLPASYISYLGKIEDAFNTFSSDNIDYKLGTIYQFGPDNKFKTLKIVSSQEYPSWDGQFIANSYIPGSNINMPNIIFQINTELNRSYTGMQEGQIVIVEYVVGANYYTGVVKMLRIDGYDGLCYQIQSININEIFETSVKMIGDVDIQGNLNVKRYNGDTVISTDNTRGVTTFQGKVGINQQSHEVKGLLDIDNLTQQGVLDLFDDFIPGLTNSYDIIQVIRDISLSSSSYLSVSTIHDISGLFAQGNSLFDYRNQCTVFSVPIKAIIKPENINIVHTDGIEVVMGNQRSVGLGKSIITSDYSFRRLQQLVKEVNQMAPEIEAANDPSYIFSFIELIQNENKNWYVVSMRAHNSGTIANEMVFVMTYINVNYIMNDKSTAKGLLAVMDYTSRELRFLNYVCLLFKDSVLIDSEGNYTVDNDNSIKLQNSIKNNPYFSNRWDLLPESYIFSLNRSKNDVYMLMEGATQWNNKMPIDCWNGDNNVQLVVDIILGQNTSLYNDRRNSSFPIHYRWREGRKISFTNTIDVGNNVYVIGSGFDLNSLLGQSLVVKGDNTIAGNFYVSDSNNVNIFKVDNVQKTITNSYRVGIGMDEPKSILDIKDTTVNDIHTAVKAARKQYIIMNDIASNLRKLPSIDDTTDFSTIINNVVEGYIVDGKPMKQTIDSYYVLLKVNTDTMISGDITFVSHWLYPNWTKGPLGTIVDIVNNTPLQSGIGLLQHILDTQLLFDNSMIFGSVRFTFGWKFVRSLCLELHGNMYLLSNGLNIQSFNLRPDTNPNIHTFISNKIRGIMMINHIILNMTTPTRVFNKTEHLNYLNRLNSEFNQITIKTFMFKIDTNDITKTSVNYIELDSDGIHEQNDRYTNIFEMSDKNDVAKHKNFWINFMRTNYAENLHLNNWGIINYDDLYADYETGFNCIDVTDSDEGAGKMFTLLCFELRTQDIIIPSLNVEGDAKIIGDLLITNNSTGKNFVSIDPDNKYMGINTDERYINYSDMVYSTTSNVYAAKHNVHVYGETYPIMVCERLLENAIDTSNNDVSKDDPRYFGTYTAMTLKRTSQLYTFDQMIAYAAELNKRMVPADDKVTHLRYGTDMSFEICDNTDRTVEIGNVQMVIDRIDTIEDKTHLRGGFSIQVSDPGGEGRTFENSRRNLMYVDNSSRLFVKEISLNGRILSTDGSGNLLCDGGNIYVSSANYPYQRVFPTIKQLQLNLNNKFINHYGGYVNSMIKFFNANLTNVKYMDLLDNYSLSNSDYQQRLVSMVNHYDISNNPVRVQMVTVSGNIFADSNYSENHGDVSTQSTNIYNNPEISQAILVGIGGMARCTTNTKLLNVCIGTENKWGTIVLTRLIMEVPVPVE